jgi:hypothetical protein
MAEQPRQKRPSPNEGKKVLDKWPANLIKFALIISQLTLWGFAGLRYGDPMNCGTGLDEMLCYLPGTDILPDMVIVSTIFIIVAVLLLLPDTKAK